MSSSFRRNGTRLILLLFVFAALLSSGCTTTPLTLSPRIKPSEYAVAVKFQPLHMYSFVDEMPPEQRMFSAGWMKKSFREPPVDIFNDVLLSSLRASQAFELVDRNRPAGSGRYILKGRLLSLGTQERAFKFALAPSTMRVTAKCVTHFSLEDTVTGEVLIDEVVTSDGLGGVSVSGGGTGQSIGVDQHGTMTHSTYQQAPNYDSTGGYESSMSDAIANNVSLITERIFSELSEQAAEPEATEDEALEQDAPLPTP